MKTKLIAFDLDGTLRRPASDSKFINEPHDQLPIEGALECLEYIADKYPDSILVGITNQGGVAAGYKTLANCKVEQLITLLAFFPLIDCILFCPDDGKTMFLIDMDLEDNSEELAKLVRLKSPVPIYRKPGIGMLEYVRSSVGIDKDNVIYVGDMESDKEMAGYAEVDFVWNDNFLANYEEILNKKYGKFKV